ncbi:MAG: chemotaxis response regulator protein-glutamate methylesterase [Clostridiaceae bacterium]|nr:chemotaxis response regulator protein-glutamate methylesterase [Clostridiaceae bacterium]
MDGKGKQIRVLVVDDSAFMRKVVSDILNSDNEIEVVDTAKNGLEAVSKVKELKPDVITLDVKMPVMDGLECLRKINDIPGMSVVVLSSVTKEGTEATIQALADGAIDFIAKPDNIFDMNGEEKKKEVIEKIKVAGYSAKGIKDIEETGGNTSIENKYSDAVNIVAIGSSTGGPKALQNVISQIPQNINAAFLVVQHMPAGFTRSLAERLNTVSFVTVKEAEDNDIVKTGHVYIAAGDYHMVVEKKERNTLVIRLTKDPPIGGLRPSVDVMMESLSKTGIDKAVGVIMTGMGGDGSEGIKKLKNRNNAYIIAQEESSCVVFGMPRVAIQTGVVDAVVTLKDIANEIIRIVGVHE